jgi:hypothetical protein
VAGDLTQADGVSLALTWLQGHSRVLAAFADRVGGVVEPPYPRLVVVPGLSSFDAIGWSSAQDVDLRVYDDRAGATGDAELRRLCALALLAVLEMDDQSYGPADAVIYSALTVTGPTSSPETGGHNRWVATARLGLHPPVT